MGLIVYTGGTFDLFHVGHVRLLRRCAQMGSQVIVGLNTDEFVEHYKGSAPVCSYMERREVLLACTHVSAVVKNVGGADSRPAILAAHADLIAIGSDWARKDYHGQMGFTQEWLDEHGIGLAYLPYTTGISTTILRGRR